MKLRTGKTSFWVFDDGQRYHGDHIRRLSLMQDKRPKAKKWQRHPDLLAAQQRTWDRKLRLRYDGLIKQLVRIAIQIAHERGETGIYYDDRERSFATHFPYDELRAALTEQCRNESVELRNGTLAIQCVEGIPTDDAIREAALIQVLPPSDPPTDLLEELEKLNGPLWECNSAHEDCLCLIVGVSTVEELNQLRAKIRRVRQS